MNASPRWHQLIAVGLLLGLLALSAPARAGADDPDTRAARAQFQRGEAAYQQGRFDQALSAYQAAYAAKPLPGFLFNVAQCYRNLGNDERAVFFYRRYLSLDPKTDNRALVEQLIAESQKRLAPVTPPVPAVGTPPVRTAPPPLRLRPSPALTPPPMLVATPPAPTADRQPLHRRWWLWATIGGVVAAGTVTALLLSRGGDPARPAGDLGTIDWR
jgi:tetratricopeptide (TPR) repeat protein